MMQRMAYGLALKEAVFFEALDALKSSMKPVYSIAANQTPTARKKKRWNQDHQQWVLDSIISWM